MVDEHGVLPPNPDFTGTRLNLYLCYIDITRPKGKASWAYFLKAQAPFHAFPLRSFLFTRSLRVSVFVQHSWIVFTSTTLPRSTHSSLSYLSLKEHTQKKNIKINSYCPKYSWMCALPPECGWFSRIYTQRKMAVPSPTANNCPLPHGCVWEWGGVLHAYLPSPLRLGLTWGFACSHDCCGLICVTVLLFPDVSLESPTSLPLSSSSLWAWGEGVWQCVPPGLNCVWPLVLYTLAIPCISFPAHYLPPSDR